MLLMTISNDQFKKIFELYKMDITWISCDSLHAQTSLVAMISPLIARWLARPQT